MRVLCDGRERKATCEIEKDGRMSLFMQKDANPLNHRPQHNTVPKFYEENLEQRCMFRLSVMTGKSARV